MSIIKAHKVALFCNLGVVLFCVVAFVYLNKTGGFPWIMILPAVFATSAVITDLVAIKRLGGSLWKSAK